MFTSLSPHSRAVLQALFITFLWSTSWVLIKLGLRDAIPALTFAGLRYVLAFLCLLPLLLRRPHDVAALRQLPRASWLRLALLGLLMYSATQGAQFVGLAYLPSITVNLLLSLTSLIVAGLGIWLLREHPTGVQWFGVAVYVVGVVIFFFPLSLPQDQLFGIGVVLGGVLANAAAALLGRAINRAGALSPLAVTVATMGMGSVVLLAAGMTFQGLPAISLTGWLLITWLAVVNTAFAFTLWNHTLRELSAMESSIINNMMMVQIPILAWLFLGEGISLKSGVGFAIAGVGILIVQVRRLPRRRAGVAVTGLEHAQTGE
jgi:drug/metabolite transporter (DMT)-like permease